LKTAKVADFTLLRAAQREVKIYCHGGYQCHDARKQFTNSKLEIRNNLMEKSQILKRTRCGFDIGISDFCLVLFA